MKIEIFASELFSILNEIKSIPVFKAKYNRDDDKVYFEFSGDLVTIIRHQRENSRSIFQKWYAGNIVKTYEGNKVPDMVFNTCDIIKIFADFAALNSDVVNIGIDEYTNRMTFSLRDYYASVTGKQDVMLEVPEGPVIRSVIIPAEMLQATYETIADEGNWRACLKGVHITVRDKKLICESSDAHIATIRKMPLTQIKNKIDEKGLDVIIPKKFVKALLATKEKEFRLEFFGSLVFCGNLTAELITENYYVNLEMVIPNNTTQKLEIKLAELESVLKTMKGKTMKGNNGLRLLSDRAEGLGSMMRYDALADSWQPVCLRHDYLAGIVKYVKKLDRTATILFEKTGLSNGIKFSCNGIKDYYGVISKIIK